MIEKFIQQQRTRHNMTQEYLASELSMSRPTYIQIERGKRELTVTEAKKLAVIFDMTLDDFLACRETKHKVILPGNVVKKTRQHADPYYRKESRKI